MTNHALWFLLFIPFVLFSCGPSSTTTEKRVERDVAIDAAESSESLFRRGHELFVDRSYDSAVVLLRRSASIDSTNIRPLKDLALIHYDLALQQRSEEHSSWEVEFRGALDCYSRMESLGQRDADTYERLCEISHALGERVLFLRFARKNADRFPGDRQAHNLGLAQSLTGDHAGVIKTQKEAIEKYPHSPFIGGFYRLLGNAYMDVDRHQTAERTYAQGVEESLKRMNELQTASNEIDRNGEYQRLKDERIAMLLSLKKLHILYKETDKLHAVERLLRDAGSSE